MNTDDGQTRVVLTTQQRRSESTTMTASAVGNGGHRRERTNNNRRIGTTGGNDYKKERFEMEPRKPRIESATTAKMINLMIAEAGDTATALSGSLHHSAVRLVPQSPCDSKGPTSETTTTPRKQAPKKNATTKTTRKQATKTTTTPRTTIGNTLASAPAEVVLHKDPAAIPNTTTTTSTTISNKAVCLVPQSYGSKGTQQKHQAGNTKEKDPEAEMKDIAFATATTEVAKDASYDPQLTSTKAGRPTTAQTTDTNYILHDFRNCTKDPVDMPYKDTEEVSGNHNTNGLMRVTITPPMDMWKLLKTKRWHTSEISCRRAKRTFRQHDWYFLFRIKATTILATPDEVTRIHEVCIPRMTFETLRMVKAPQPPVESRTDQRPIVRQHYMITVTKKKIYRKNSAISTVPHHQTVKPTSTQQKSTSSAIRTQHTREVRAIHSSQSSYLLPLPWQHHAWLAPPHRKTLRQQPFQK
jgi:hypothetical protein